ncbi:MAG: CBS domain-containing protein [Hyphomicrobiales bacterium]
MVAREYMINDIVPLKTSDSSGVALQLMDEYKVSQFPIVNNTSFLGLISETDIVLMDDLSLPIGNHKLLKPNLFIEPCKHMFDVIRYMFDNSLSLVPIVSDDTRYEGVITYECLLKACADLSSSDSPGSIIVLEMSDNDYYLSELTRLLEEENTKVLSLGVKTFPNSTKIEVNLKVNKIDISRILSTLQRFNYVIKASWTESPDDNESLRNRYDSLMKYLDI